jgi:hypothetical protein
MVEEDSVSLVVTAQDRPADPLATFDLDTLITAAARLRPERTFVTDTADASVTFAALDERSRHMAALFASLGLVPGDCLLLAATARCSTIVALAAALRAGLDVALAPPHLTSDETAAFAARTRAVAVAAGNDYGPLSPIETMMGVAAVCQDIRLVGALDGAVDGAVDLSEPCTAPLPGASASRIVTYVPGGALRHTQRTLIAAALDYMSQTQLGMQQPLVTTIPPASFAGLVAGPLAALVSGAMLHLHGPFSTAPFLELIEREAPVHLVAPGALASALQQASLLEGDVIASVSLLHRAVRAEETHMPLDGGKTAVFDFTAFGETAAVVEPRDADGLSLPPALTPHMIEVGGRSLTAVRRMPAGGPIRFEGEAVTHL